MKRRWPQSEVMTIDVPPQHAGVIELAWRRIHLLTWGLPVWLLEAMRPMLIGIYLQGVCDGVTAAEKRGRDDNEKPAV